MNQTEMSVYDLGNGGIAILEGVIKERDETITALRTQLAERDTRVAELTELLEQFDFAHYDSLSDGYFCTICGNFEGKGHKEDCEFKLALKESEKK